MGCDGAPQGLRRKVQESFQVRMALDVDVKGEVAHAVSWMEDRETQDGSFVCEDAGVCTDGTDVWSAAEWNWRQGSVGECRCEPCFWEWCEQLKRSERVVVRWSRGFWNVAETISEALEPLCENV